MFKIPLSWRFQVESDQIEKIKACDCKALETFYFLNYEKIRALALSYAKVGEDFAVWLRDLPHVGGMKE